jgi:adenylate kinase
MLDECNVIAVFGISGVGKSTLIEGFIKDHPEYTHIQAGTLIRQALKNVPRDKLRIADTDTIIKNQYLLIDEFWKEVKEHSYSSIIFDGHSIIDTDTTVVEVPADIIKSLKPCKIIFIEDDPQQITNRRTQDTSRNRPDLSADNVKDHQEKARNQAVIYASQIGIPFFQIQSGQLSAFAHCIFP